MSYPTKPEENAFALYVPCNEQWENGLTKREYIAVMALQGILAYPSDIQSTSGHLARHAVKCADALIKALNEEVAE